MKLAYILDDDLEVIPDPTLEKSAELEEKQKEDDFLCKGQILNVLSNFIYDVYRAFPSAKDLWKSLETKYKIEEVGINFLSSLISW